jgi:hypothetical protein
MFKGWLCVVASCSLLFDQSLLPRAKRQNHGRSMVATGCSDSGVEVRAAETAEGGRYLLGGSGEALPCVALARLKSGAIVSG